MVVTGSLATAISIASLSSDLHFGIYAEGVADVAVLNGSLLLSGSMCRVIPNIG